MVSFISAAALALHFPGTWAVPQTFSPDPSTAYSLGPQITKAPTGNCSNDCVYEYLEVSCIRWSQMSITATYTAETVVFIVNKKNNSTRTTTISNNEIDFDKIATPTNLNGDSTVTASVVDNDGSTRIVAYPTTVYGDYPASISWTGTLSSTVSGIPTCLIAPRGTVAVYPSHPLLPEAVQTQGVDMTKDPRGWTFVVGFGPCGYDSLVKNFFPGFEVWNCNPLPPAAGAPAPLHTALYLTTTSTSTEPDDGPTSTEATVLSTKPSQAHAEEPASADTPISTTHPAEIPPPIETTSSEALLNQPPLTQPPSKLGGPGMISPVHGSVPSTTSAQIIHGPAILESASATLSVVMNPPVSESQGIVITPSPALATTLSTTPVAVLVPVTSTDSKGSITISISTAIAHPIIVSSTNAQGNIVLSTSLSTASISASLPIIISSSAQGTTFSSTAYLAAIILTTTNAAGSNILTTSPLSLPTSPASANAPITVNGEIISPNAQSQYIISGFTLSAGGSSITIGSGSSTTVLALHISGSETALVYASSTSVLAPMALPTTPPVITIGSEIITANSKTQYIYASQTLTAGGIVNINGTRVSLAASESDIVIGSSTEALAPYITAGFGSGTNGTGVWVFAGDAEKRWGWSEGWGLRWAVMLGVVMWV